MKKICTSAWILLLTASAIFAQQDHQYTQFMYNKLLLNPAYSGARGIPTVTAIYRNQWAGFEGAPNSALVSLNSPFLSPRVGVGVVLSHQQAGLQRDFYGNLAYSYDLIGSENLSLRVGVQGSLRSLAINFSEAQTGTTAGQTNPATDQSLETQRINDIYGNVGAGIYATILRKIYVGFSVPRIYTNTLGFNPNAALTTAKEYRHYYATAGGIIPIGDGLNLLPAVLVKYVDGAPIDADINLNLDVNQKITFGVSGRLGGDSGLESLDLLAFWQLNPQVGLGAAYDFSLSRIRDYTAGSFEIMAQVDLQKEKPNNKKGRKNLSNPRFFL